MWTSARESLGGQAAKHLFFHERLGQAHVDAALDLPAREHRVDGAADVMGDPDLRHVHPSGPRVDLDLHHARGVGIGRRRADARATRADHLFLYASRQRERNQRQRDH